LILEKLELEDSMRKIKDILPSILNKMGINKGIKQAKAIAFWDDIVGDNIAKNAKAFRARKGILYVAVKSSVWASELQMMEPEIRKKINEYLNNNVIKELRFYPPRYREIFREDVELKINKEQTPQVKKLTKEIKRKIDEISSQISDTKLKEAFKKVMKKFMKTQ
jgi:hypothetical protein